MPQDTEGSQEDNPSNHNPMNMLVNETKKIMNDLTIDDGVTRPVADPFLYLMQDHRQITQHIKLAEEATDHKEQTKHCEHITTLLTLHAQLEEATLYPTLEQRNETHDLTEEAYEEHSLTKDLLEQLGNVDAGTDEWKAKLTVLKENIEHHVLEEEGELFPKAKDILSDAEQKRLAHNMEQFLQGYEK